MNAVVVAWNHFWFRPASPLGPIAVRILLSVQALWIVLSRPELPNLVAWPDAFWTDIPTALRFRFFVFARSSTLEWILWATLIILLLLLIVRGGRLAAFVAGILLYHFAPMENILSGAALLGFRGLTQPVQGLLILSFARQPHLHDQPSPEYRWPVAAIQLLFSLTYFFAGLSKLFDAGWSWVSADNMQATAMVFTTWPVSSPWAAWLIAHRGACWVIGVGTLALELLFPLVLFSPLAAKILVPIAFIGHIGIAYTLGIYFLSSPLLLLFLNWDWVAEAFARASSTGRPTSAPSHLE